MFAKLSRASSQSSVGVSEKRDDVLLPISLSHNLTIFFLKYLIAKMAEEMSRNTQNDYYS